MRLFVAIELDEKFRRRLIDLQESLRVVAPEVSFTKPDNLHLTLKFIGEIEEAKLPALCEVLEGIQKPGQFTLNLTGLDLLPERGPIRILAAAVDGGEKLLALQAAIEEACATQNIPKENRRYRPHITLARARRPLPRPAKSRLLDAVTPGDVVAMTVTEFVLMQSKLSNKGSVYLPLQHVSL
jgi:2'-5' RNA ligase